MPSPPRIYLLVATCFLLCSCAQETIVPERIVRLSVSSVHTGTTYPIAVYLPEDYSPAQSYETLFFLDGEYVLSPGSGDQRVIAINEEMAARFGKKAAIVVGIGGDATRERDFTTVNDPRLGNGGGAENYARFLEQELIPRLQQDFPMDTTAQGRVLSGHSLGGSFVGYMFSDHPDVFGHFLCLSPAFWYGDGDVLRKEETSRAAQTSRNSIVFVGCGEFEGAIAILAEEFYLRLKNYYPNVRSDFKKLKNRSHVSSIYANLSNGLEWYYQNQ